MALLRELLLLALFLTSFGSAADAVCYLGRADRSPWPGLSVEDIEAECCRAAPDRRLLSPRGRQDRDRGLRLLRVSGAAFAALMVLALLSLV